MSPDRSIESKIDGSRNNLDETLPTNPIPTRGCDTARAFEVALTAGFAGYEDADLFEFENYYFLRCCRNTDAIAKAES